MNSSLRVRLLLAAQTALLGRIVPNIRAISCGFVDGNIKARVIFDGAILDSDREMMDEVGSELASHFEDANVDVECVRIDAPQKFRDEMLDCYVYLRRE
ncbi:hypothetical protein CJO78_18835 (plasmid) [Ralstonia solanacearum]|nr:hypothetical protein LBM2029_18300 [Ralstonia solanacearum]AXV89417.1 hypothetical protein CJO78_18835 [Ralstonia solanacearum]AXW08881.1 hypothetical protein CJO82_18490 [Ralstonia solanacearum]AXW26667.1 hypothetical protein CJO86_18745 [Ralstonia solanacearum]AXW83581.1 hypothetical protein CJO98_18850 [Ralstonia solanacearum]